MMTVLTKQCEVCKAHRIPSNITMIKLNKKPYDVCKECKEELRWTRTCLAISAKWLVNKFPEKYENLTRYVVTPLR